MGDYPFYCLYGHEPPLPVNIKFLPPAADDLSTSVLDHRKRIVEKVELAKNLACENIQRSQQKMNTTIAMQVNHFSKSDNMFGFTHQKGRRAH